MKITEIKYGRKKNLGNYESEELVMTAVIDEGEECSDAFLRLKNEVDSGLGYATKVEKIHTCNCKQTSKSDPIPEIKEEKNTQSEITEDGFIKLPDGRIVDPVDGIEIVETEPVQTIEEKPKKSKKVAPPPAKKEEDTSIKYDRENKEHRKKLSGILNLIDSTWASDDSKKVKAKGISEKLNGASFLNGADIVESFKLEVQKLWVEIA